MQIHLARNLIRKWMYFKYKFKIIHFRIEIPSPQISLSQSSGIWFDNYEFRDKIRNSSMANDCQKLLTELFETKIKLLNLERQNLYTEEKLYFEFLRKRRANIICNNVFIVLNWYILYDQREIITEICSKVKDFVNWKEQVRSGS